MTLCHTKQILVNLNITIIQTTFFSDVFFWRFFLPKNFCYISENVCFICVYRSFKIWIFSLYLFLSSDLCADRSKTDHFCQSCTEKNINFQGWIFSAITVKKKKLQTLIKYLTLLLYDTITTVHSIIFAYIQSWYVFYAEYEWWRLPLSLPHPTPPPQASDGLPALATCQDKAAHASRTRPKENDKKISGKHGEKLFNSTNYFFNLWIFRFIDLRW